MFLIKTGNLITSNIKIRLYNCFCIGIGIAVLFFFLFLVYLPKSQHLLINDNTLLHVWSIWLAIVFFFTCTYNTTLEHYSTYNSEVWIINYFITSCNIKSFTKTDIQIQCIYTQRFPCDIKAGTENQGNCPYIIYTPHTFSYFASINRQQIYYLSNCR